MPGARALVFVGLSIAGLIALLIAGRKAAATSASAGLVIELLTAIVVAALAFFIRSESTSEKFRTELFTAMLLVALALACSALLGYLFEARTGPDAPADTLGRRVAVAGIVLIVVATAIKMLYTTAVENELASGVVRYRISILWFILFAAVRHVAAAAHPVRQLDLRRRRQQGGRPGRRCAGGAHVKTTLFMIVSGAAWFAGMLIAFRLNSVQANVGDGEEFEYIIAAVVGGNLLTGGYGSVAGGAIGSLIMAMSTQGIPFAGWNTNWRFLFLGVILLLAVIANNYVRNKAAQSK